jgi:hypothetical protein
LLEANPDLVVRDEDGGVYTVRYDAVNAMLLNEFLKEHSKVQQLETTIAQLKMGAVKQEAIEMRQQEEIRALTPNLKEQAKQLKQVNAQPTVGKPVARLANNN